MRLFLLCAIIASTDDHHQTEAGRRRGRRPTLSRAWARRSGQTVRKGERAGESPLLDFDYSADIHIMVHFFYDLHLLYTLYTAI